MSTPDIILTAIAAIISMATAALWLWADYNARVARLRADDAAREARWAALAPISAEERLLRIRYEPTLNAAGIFFDDDD